jgi:hypothetical protein
MNFDAQVDYIMDNFNFGKVARHMESVGWGWGNEDGGLSVPSETKLRKTARGLLRHLKDNCHASTGGFCAYKANDVLFLGFSIEAMDGSEAENDHEDRD